MRHPFLASALAVAGLAAPAWAQMPPVPVPSGNPTTTDKVNLGQVLFWDEQLSSTRTVACGTCHRPETGGEDPRSAFAVNPGADGVFGTPDDVRGSPGVPRNLQSGLYEFHPIFGVDIQVTGRKAPPTINAAFNPEQFWDGREGSVFRDPLTGTVVLGDNASLESQAKNPPTGDNEMSHVGRDWQDVANRVAASKPLALSPFVPPALDAWINNRTYAQMFNAVFNDPAITPSRILMAIGAYERTLISDQTPFDTNSLTAQQQWGLDLFGGKARCNLCHEAPLFRDDQYHNIGVRPSSEDTGRFAVTNKMTDMGAFKTPGLRNSGLRSVYMHNGRFDTLEEVIEFYDRGGDFFDNLDPQMQPLGLTTAEKVALVDFLRNGLLDPRITAAQPPFDRPALYSEGQLVPQQYGSGTTGTGGFEPRLTALEPPMLGNPNMTINFTSGMPNAFACVGFDIFQGIGFPFMGIPLNIAGSSATVVLPLGMLKGTMPGEGHWSGTLKVPNDSNMKGQSIFLQGFSVDPGSAAGVSATAGVQMTFFESR